jgi:biopolymer transport protein ExbD
MLAARQAGYTQFRMRVTLPEGWIEGEFELGTQSETSEAEPPVQHAVQISADEKGRITKITVCDDSSTNAVDHGTDLVALLHCMQTRARAAERDCKAAHLAIEADPRLLHSHLVQVIDIGTRAGFDSVCPSLLIPHP